MNRLEGLLEAVKQIKYELDARPIEEKIAEMNRINNMVKGRDLTVEEIQLFTDKFNEETK